MLAATAYNADIGRTVFFALLIGIPTAIIAGPIFSTWIAPRIRIEGPNPIAAQFIDDSPKRDLPGFGVTLATILLPIALMLIGSWADTLSPPPGRLNAVLHLLGSADIALLIAAIVSFITLGQMRGFSRETILKFTNECLAPTATITLLVGAGGGLGRVLQDSGTSQAIVELALRAHLSILFSAWLVAALVRLATGSSTVAMTMAAAIIAPISTHTGVRPELLTIATGAGALIFSHFNDGGFWLVKEYFNMSVAQTIKTWSICETIISVVALLLTMFLSVFV
jgi:GntP family gluconate:H+ symporter